MKKSVILIAVLFLAAFIVLPASSNGKYNVSKPLVADGWPLSPGPGAYTLVADGGPMPPPFPPNPPTLSFINSDSLVADGGPMPPPFPPNPPNLSFTNSHPLVADGGPMPPPFPPNPPPNTASV